MSLSNLAFISSVLLSPSLDKFSNSSSPASRSFHLLAGSLCCKLSCTSTKSRRRLQIKSFNPASIGTGFQAAFFRCMSSAKRYISSSPSLMMRTLWRCGKSGFRCWNIRQASKTAYASDRLHPKRFSIVLMQLLFTKSSQSGFGQLIGCNCTVMFALLMVVLCVLCMLWSSLKVCALWSLVTCTFCTTDELELGVQGFFFLRCVLIFAFSLSVWTLHLGQTKRLSLFLLIASVYFLISSSFIFMLPDPLNSISSLYGWRPYSILITNTLSSCPPFGTDHVLYILLLIRHVGHTMWSSMWRSETFKIIKYLKNSETASIHKQLWKSLRAYFGKPEKNKYLNRCTILVNIDKLVSSLSWGIPTDALQR